MNNPTQTAQQNSSTDQKPGQQQGGSPATPGQQTQTVPSKPDEKKAEPGKQQAGQK